MDDEFLINILVAGKRYPITIRRSEEETFRSAAKWIDKKIVAYQERCEVPLDKQDVLALIALQSVVEQLNMEQKLDESPMNAKIQEWNDALERYLKENK